MPSILTISPPARPKRRYFTSEQKRLIVEEATTPGASVSAVARAHDLNTNQVFKWCRELRRTGPQASGIELPLLQVQVAESEVPMQPRVPTVAPEGRIECQFARCRLVLTGAVDGAILNLLLDRLLA